MKKGKRGYLSFIILISFIMLFGTVGALEMDSITLVEGAYRLVGLLGIIGVALYFKR